MRQQRAAGANRRHTPRTLARRDPSGVCVVARSSQRATRSRARAKTASIIGSVSRPVNVFCWLRVEAAEERAAGRRRRTRRRGRSAAAAAGRRPAGAAQAQRGVPGEAAEADDHRTRGSSSSSRTDHGRQVSRSAGVGWLAGGAQRTAAAIAGVAQRAARRRACVEVGWLAKPGAVQRGEQPVARAVAGEHAAGAVAAVGGGREAEHAGRARAGSPKPGIGGPSTPRRDTRRACSRATCSRQATSRGQRAAGDDLVERSSVARERRATAATRSRPLIERAPAEHEPRDHGLERGRVSGRPVRSWRATSSTAAPITANASSGVANVGAP